MTPITKSRSKPAEAEDTPTALASAKGALMELLEEQAGIAVAVSAAVEEADSAALIRLRRRSDEIGVDLWAARVRVARLTITEVEAKRPAIDDAVEAANDRWEIAKAALDAAQAAFDEANNAVYVASQDAMSCDQELHGARSVLDRVTTEKAPSLAPIVRSRLPVPKAASV